MTPKPSDGMDHPLAEPGQGMVATASIPPELASLEAAMFAKYRVTNLADLESAVFAKHEVEAGSSESQQGSGLKVRKAQHKAEAHPPQSQKGSGLRLRRAHQKGSGLKVRKAHPEAKAHTPESEKGSGLNLRRAHHKHHKVEANSEKGSGLKLRKAHPKVKAHSLESWKGSGLKLRRAHHNQHEVEAHRPDSQQVSGLKVRKHKHNLISKRKHEHNALDRAQTPPDASQKARFKLKKMTPLYEVPKEVIGTFGQIIREAPSPAQEVEGKKVMKNVVMRDTLNYRDQAATMHHAEPTLRQSMAPEQVSLAWEEALAKEESKKPSRLRSTKTAPGSILRRLTRCIFFLAGLCIIAGIAYHKSQVIAAVYSGNLKPQKFKAKPEDMFGFAPAPCFSPEVTTGSHVSAVVGSFRQGLSRRCTTDTPSPYGFGV